jgi:hypothetical protein
MIPENIKPVLLPPWTSSADEAGSRYLGICFFTETKAAIENLRYL